MVVTLGQQYNINHIEEKPTVMLYTYINRHAETPDKNKTKKHFECVSCVFFPFILDVKFSLDVPAGVTQEEGHTGFIIHLPSAVRA